MTDAAQTPQPTLPTVSSTKLRGEIEAAVLKDLLGPAGGPEEEVDESSVRERYLVGMLAPRQQHQAAPEEFDELAVAGAGDGDEGTVEPTIPQTQAMFPSSFGLTFSVDGAVSAIRVTAKWGFYDRTDSDVLTTPKLQKPKQVWKRQPVESTSDPIPLREGPIRWTPASLVTEVVVQGRCRRRGACWLVTLFLVNGQTEPKKLKDRTWLFQPELIVDEPEGAAIFRRHLAEGVGSLADGEARAMAMLYRRRVEFAVGHGVGVHVDLAADSPERAIRVRTCVVPESDIEQVTPPTSDEIPELETLVLDMKDLAEAPSGDLPRLLEPLVVGYSRWIGDQVARIDARQADLVAHEQGGREAVVRCQAALERIRAGIELLSRDVRAAQAFQFMNRAMWQQRVHGLLSLAVRRGTTTDFAAFDIPPNRRWYPFQLAFILLNLPSLTALDHPDRADEPDAVADLLWFPTGGGKTEAYLGLTAYTLAIRRLQGAVAGRSGEDGVAVLMRYTLRLLTLQQFQRATTLVAACEMIRRDALGAGDPRWGTTPFRIGLWVGGAVTPNTTKDSAEAVRSAHSSGRPTVRGTPLQLTNCPWCGTRIEIGRDIQVDLYPGGSGRTLIYCGDVLGRCPFSQRQAPGEGLPVVVVDEEVYRRLPAVLIATVDKFAQMPWRGAAGMLFGQVDGTCSRHGFRSPDIEDADSHPKKGATAAARTTPVQPLRPPDLIIQDELHLISGPLGTLVGLYETAIDKLASWEVNGRAVRPKVVASTATIRRAADQVHGIFVRRVSVFPPQGLDVEDNFFARQRAPSERHPGRRYIGICAPGRRLKGALIRVYVAFLSASQAAYEKYGEAADPWMTMVGYFNAMRELGGARRLLDDDVRSRLRRVDLRGLTKRDLYPDRIDELTSRKRGAQIPQVLDRLETPFAPPKKKGTAGSTAAARTSAHPLDVLLATNMLSVGVDVRRLGLMVVCGQPKTTAEYIQATSRVGRQYPGLVCTVFNWVRPRDLSHYERFEHYHDTFYTHVEALSVTPFAPRAIDRGLTGVLVSCIRLAGIEFNGNPRAAAILRNHPYVRAAVDHICKRAHLVGNGAAVEQLVRAELERRLDEWLAEAANMQGGRQLGYAAARDGLTVGLLKRPGGDRWENFTCLTSLRDVEPTVGLVLSEAGMDAGLRVSVASQSDDASTDADGAGT